MNFSDPILKLKHATRRANDAALNGDYDESIAQLDSIREYALAAQEALKQARARRDRLEVRTT